MVDVTEILQHWYAGRPKVEVARSLGVDAKTVRRYVAAGGGGRDGAGRPAGERGAVAGAGPAAGSRSWPGPGSGRCPGGRSRFIMTGSPGCCPWCRCR